MGVMIKMIENFKTFIESIFGIYQPITEVNSLTGEVISNVDFGYIASVVIFLVVLCFVLRTVGGLIYEWLR